MSRFALFLLLFVSVFAAACRSAEHHHPPTQPVRAKAMNAPHDAVLTTWTKSWELYHQPHAVWLSGDQKVGTNRELLVQLLAEAEKQQRVPELVVYSIPLRDLGQSSEGGFKNYDDYLADKRHDAHLIAEFTRRTKIRPRVILEPDALAMAVQYREDHHHDVESERIYLERVNLFQKLIPLYHEAGADVYLEAAHSGWFDYADENITRMTNILNAAGIAHADGLVTNISNRQLVAGNLDNVPPDPVRDPTPTPHEAKEPEHNEYHYIGRLLPRLERAAGKMPLVIVVDTSRNGRQRGGTHPREYFLSPQGRIYDSEHGDPRTAGRLIGTWREGLYADFDPGRYGVPKDFDLAFKGVWLYPRQGKVKPLKLLIEREKYTWNADTRILSAPPWLDPVGDVQLGPYPTDKPAIVNDRVHRFRYVKPPDDCDGAVGCPPGQSKSEINRMLDKPQKK